LTQYEVVIVTGSVANAGTDANVSIVLYGDKVIWRRCWRVAREWPESGERDWREWREWSEWRESGESGERRGGEMVRW
jgi:hypothetical protein